MPAPVAIAANGIATIGQPTSSGNRPSYSITGDLDTNDVAQKLLFLRVLDSAGEKNSKCEIQLDNRDLALNIPAKGANFQINMGYDGNVRNMGSYTLDEIVMYGPPHTVTLTGHALDTAGPGFGQKNVSWHNQPLFSIVQKLAQNMGLVANIDPGVTNSNIDHIDQTSQSDVAFLSELSQKYAATFKVMNGTLYFAPQSGGTTQMDGATVYWTEDTKYNYQTQGRGAYSGALARYVDTTMGQEKIAAVGDINTKAKHVQELQSDQTSAQTAAQSTADAAASTVASLDLNLPGDPTIMSALPLSIVNFPPYMETTWKLDEVEHQLKGGGAYTTMLRATLPAGGTSSGTSGAANNTTPSTAPSSTDMEPSNNQENNNDDHTVTEQAQDAGTST